MNPLTGPLSPQMPAVKILRYFKRRCICTLFSVFVLFSCWKLLINFTHQSHSERILFRTEAPVVETPPSATAAIPFTFSPPLPGMATFADRSNEQLRLLESFIYRFSSLFPPSKRLQNFKNPCWSVHISPNGSYYFPTSGQENLTVKDVTCLPYFFMLGYPKCGTTSLYNQLRLHSDFAPGSVKEPAWWAHEQIPIDNAMPAVAEYLRMFEPASARILRSPGLAFTGDCSTSNSFMVPFGNNASQYFTDGIPYMFSRLFPDAKFIVVMRDPVDRMCSQFYFEGYNRCIPSFHQSIGSSTLNQTVHIHIDAFKRCMQSLGDEHLCAYRYYDWVTPVHPCLLFQLHISMYYHSLYQWLHYFPRKQFLFLKSYDLDKSPVYAAHAMYNFLEMSAISKTTSLRLLYSKNRHDNSNYKAHPRNASCREVSMWPETVEVLEKFYQPFKEKLFHLTKFHT